MCVLPRDCDVPDYRLYFLNGRDQIRRAVVLPDCEDDEHAIRVVQDHADGAPAMELWLSGRLVKRFEGDPDG
jgi:hypothetical protein